MGSSEFKDAAEATHMRGDIAIVGMACMFPGAPNLHTYWQNIVDKVDAITDPPPEAWDPNVFYDPQAGDGRLYCKKGGFLGPLAFFDPLANGIMPLTAKGGEPDQWLALQIARDALTDAGYSDTIPERQRTAVILGKGSHINSGNFNVVQHGAVIDQTLDILKKLHPEYSADDLELIKREFKKQLPAFNADTVPGLIPNVAAGRIANRLDLMGPNYTVDAACASSFIAVEMAVHGLLAGQYDLALVGGVHVVTPVPILMVFSHLGALSHQQQIRPFDKDADGTILGEGVGMVVLKRLADAERDGNRIYAVIKGVGTSSDGRALGVTAPRMEGEILALERAYAMADLSPRTIGLIEAHGTGTPLGDATEIDTLNHILGPRDSDMPWCALGSVKSMVGHLMHTAGMAGLIKTALAVYHKVLPPTLHVETPHPKLLAADTPLYINTQARPWIHRSDEHPRRAGINAFGFGGINGHVILEEYPIASEEALPSYQTGWDSEVCVLAAPSRAALLERARQLQTMLERNPQTNLKDLAYTLNTNIAAAYRVAVVATGIPDLGQKLERVIERLADPKCQKIQDVRGIYFAEKPLAKDGKLAFVFPGEGSQYVNMLADLSMHFPEVRRRFDAMDYFFLKRTQGYRPSDFTFPRPAFSAADQHAGEERLWQMKGAIAVVLTADSALTSLLRRLKIEPDVLLGHSTGEYPALLAAGMLDLPDDEQIAQFCAELHDVYQRALAIESIPSAVLLAVSTGVETLAPIMAPFGNQLFIGMENCPHQTVLVGAEGPIEQVTEQLRNKGIIYERLPFDRPYHTPLFADFAGPLQGLLERWMLSAPTTPIYSCTTVGLFPQDVVEARAVALTHWMAPVKFRETVERMYADGVRIFVEAGPRGNLTAFIDDILRGKPHLAVPANVSHRSGTTQLNHLVGMLAAHGVVMDLDYLYARRDPQRLDLEQPERKEKTGQRMKLATAWPLINLSDETAARLRKETSHQPATPATLPGVPARPEMPPPPVEPVRKAEPAPAKIAAPPATNGVKHTASATPPTAYTNGTNGTHGMNTTNKSSIAGTVPASAPQPLAPAAAPSADADQVMSSYLQTMEQFLAVQQHVMQGFLGAPALTPGAPAQPAPVPAAAPQPALPSIVAPALPQATVQPPIQPAVEREPVPIVVHPATTHSTPEPAPATEQPTAAETAVPTRPEEITAALLQLVSERTGYPAEMLDLDLDLEADLGIDSIKRVEILGAFQRQTAQIQTDDMEALAASKTLREIIDFLTHQRAERSAPVPAGAPQPPAIPTLPLIGKVVSLDPGQEVVALCILTLDEDLFIRDHAFGRAISTLDHNLAGLPVMPFTMSLELLAEAASLLMPGRQLVGARDVRTYRWILLDHEQLTLRVHARRANADTIVVQLFEAADKTGSSEPAMMPLCEGRMLFADTYPTAPTSTPFSIPSERSSMWAPEQLYKDVAFHGPQFRGVISMDGINDERARATLQVLPRNELFRSNPQPDFVTDPVFLDQPGQVVGFWMYDRVAEAAIMFPSRLESLDLYGPPLPAGERLRCHATEMQLIGDMQVRSNWEVVRADGSVWARCEGWEGRRFNVPRPLVLFAFTPRERMLSVPANDMLPSELAAHGVLAYQISLDAFPKGFFTSHQAVWQITLAHLTLSARERAVWRALRLPPVRRLEWLLGRVAAKDAVRAYIHKHYGLALCPADIEITPDAHGQPQIQGAWTAQLDEVPLLSIAHTTDVALAIVGPRNLAQGLGVDIEHIARMNHDVEHMAFTPDEQALVKAAEGNYNQWLVACWCAKEAAGKALGHGLVGGPRTMAIQSIDARLGIVELRVVGELARQVPAAQHTTFAAYTRRQDDLVTAHVLYQPRKPS